MIYQFLSNRDIFVLSLTPSTFLLWLFVTDIVQHGCQSFCQCNLFKPLYTLCNNTQLDGKTSNVAFSKQAFARLMTMLQGVLMR